MYRSIKNAFIRFFGVTAEEREIRQAIRQLHTYSDRELNELGITRGQIADVVRHGRPQFSETRAASRTCNADVIELPRAA